MSSKLAITAFDAEAEKKLTIARFRADFSLVLKISKTSNPMPVNVLQICKNNGKDAESDALVIFSQPRKDA